MKENYQINHTHLLGKYSGLSLYYIDFERIYYIDDESIHLVKWDGCDLIFNPDNPY